MAEPMYMGLAIHTATIPNRDEAMAEYKNLFEKFGIAAEMATYFVDVLGYRTKEDFKKACKAETDMVAKYVDFVHREGTDSVPLRFKDREGSRLAQVWSKLCELEGEDIKRRQAGNKDLNEILATSELTELMENHWKRYRTKHLPHLIPGDALLSRMFREINSYLLTVHDPRKARSLRMDQTVKEKKVTIAEGISLNTGDPATDTHTQFANTEGHLAGL